MVPGPDRRGRALGIGYRVARGHHAPTSSALQSSESHSAQLPGPGIAHRVAPGGSLSTAPNVSDAVPGARSVGQVPGSSEVF